MELLFGILILVGILGLYDLLRRLNNNILDQTEAIKKIHEELLRTNKK